MHTAHALHHETIPDKAEFTGIQVGSLVLTTAVATAEQQADIVRLAACWNVCLAMDTNELMDLLAAHFAHGAKPRKIMFEEAE